MLKIHLLNAYLLWHVHVCVLSCFSRVQLFSTMDCSPPGSSVHGILQARILKWVVMPSSGASSQHRDPTHISCLLHWQVDSLPLVPPEKPFCGIYYLIWQKGWHHQLNGHESEQTPGDGEGQGSLACCSPGGHKVLDMTEWLSKNNRWLTGPTTIVS